MQLNFGVTYVTCDLIVGYSVWDWMFTWQLICLLLWHIKKERMIDLEQLKLIKQIKETYVTLQA